MAECHPRRTTVTPLVRVMEWIDVLHCPNYIINEEASQNYVWERIKFGTFTEPIPCFTHLYTPIVIRSFFGRFRLQNTATHQKKRL